MPLRIWLINLQNSSPEGAGLEDLIPLIEKAESGHEDYDAGYMVYKTKLDYLSLLKRNAYINNINLSGLEMQLRFLQIPSRI